MLLLSDVSVAVQHIVKVTQIRNAYIILLQCGKHTGETAIVISQNPAMRLMPKVMAVLDSGKKPIKPPKLVDRANIKRTLEKGSVSIDTSEFFI